LLILRDNLIGWSYDDVHGITVSIVKGVISVVVVTLRRISGGHVKRFYRFFIFVFGKKGKNSVPSDGATDLYLDQEVESMASYTSWTVETNRGGGGGGAGGAPTRKSAKTNK
jgi:hypothetical protein